MAAKSLQEKMLEGLRIRVYRQTDDGRHSLCGEPMERDEQGRVYFDIPAHQADYVNKTFKQYKVDETPFPAKKPVKKVAESEVEPEGKK